MLEKYNISIYNLINKHRIYERLLELLLINFLAIGVIVNKNNFPLKKLVLHHFILIRYLNEHFDYPIL